MAKKKTTEQQKFYVGDKVYIEKLDKTGKIVYVDNSKKDKSKVIYHVFFEDSNETRHFTTSEVSAA